MRSIPACAHSKGLLSHSSHQGKARQSTPKSIQSENLVPLTFIRTFPSIVGKHLQSFMCLNEDVTCHVGEGSTPLSYSPSKWFSSKKNAVNLFLESLNRKCRKRQFKHGVSKWVPFLGEIWIWHQVLTTRGQQKLSALWWWKTYVRFRFSPTMEPIFSRYKTNLCCLLIPWFKLTP